MAAAGRVNSNSPRYSRRHRAPGDDRRVGLGEDVDEVPAARRRRGRPEEVVGIVTPGGRGLGKVGEVVVPDRPGRGAGLDRQAGRARQVDGERLVGLDCPVPGHVHGDRLRRLARGEGHGAAGRGVVAAGAGRPVGGGEVHAHRPRGRLVEGHGEVEGRRPGRPLERGHPGDGGDRGVIVLDGPGGGRAGQGRTGGAGQANAERLIRLDGRVAGDGHGDGLRRLAGGEGQRAGRRPRSRCRRSRSRSRWRSPP